MRVVFVVDPIDRLDASVDTSIGLMHAAQDQHAEVWVTEARLLEVREGAAYALARPVRLAPSVPAEGCRWTVSDPWYDAGAPELLPLAEATAVFVRTEPPVDTDYLTATHVLDLVDPERTAVVNRPSGLRACSEHLLPLAFPDLAPPTLVTSRADAVAGFLAAYGRVVLKPADGFSGRGVFLLSRGDPNTASLVETATAHGSRAVLAQPYLPAVEHGNKRIFLVDGAPVGATLRHPVPGDFRISSPDAAAELTARDREIVRRLAPLLRRHGLRCAGLDVIGNHLIEVNLTSPGALRKADALLGTRFCAQLVGHVLSHPTPSRPSLSRPTLGSAA